MDAVLRAIALYFFLMIVLRTNGKRALGQITTFDFVLLLIIGEATQQALIGRDFSLTNAFIVIATLVGVDLGFSVLKNRIPAVERMIESKPLVILENGKLLKDRLAKERVDVSDILEAAREYRGLENLDQIKYAVLERNGMISIIPADKAA